MSGTLRRTQLIRRPNLTRNRDFYQARRGRADRINRELDSLDYIAT